MGTIQYPASQFVARFTDRELAHLKLVIVAKLRRNEPFTFSLDKPDGGRVSLWIAAQIPLVFEFDDSTPIEINREWIDEMNQSASSLSGLVLSPEPVA
jgi:hypothetical protein